MKWTTLLKDIKEKVGFTQSPSPSPSSATASSASPSSSSSVPPSSARDKNALSARIGSFSPSRFGCHAIYFCCIVKVFHF